MLYFCWTVLALTFLVPHVSLCHLGPGSSMRQELPQLHRTSLLLLPKTPLPKGVTNLLPFCFRHPELVVAQEEGPHGLANLRLNAPIVDEAQQLLFLVTLWWEVGGGGSKEFGQQKTRAWTLTAESCFSDLTLRECAVNEQNLMYPDIHCGIKRESRILETPQLPTNGGTVRLYMGILPRE